MASRYSKLLILLALVVVISGPAFAQSQRGDVSDVDRRYPPLEVGPTGRLPINSCFPIVVADCRVHVVVYELKAGSNLGDGPIHDPRPDLERALASRLNDAYPTWVVADSAESSDLRIEVVLYRLDDASGIAHWVVRTDWYGRALRGFDARCVASRTVYTSDPASEANGIVDQMRKGPGSVRRLPWGLSN